MKYNEKTGSNYPDQGLLVLLAKANPLSVRPHGLKALIQRLGNTYLYPWYNLIFLIFVVVVGRLLIMTNIRGILVYYHEQGMKRRSLALVMEAAAATGLPVSLVKV